MASYTLISKYGKMALVREEWALPLANALFDGTGCQATGKTGRGRVMRLYLEDSAAIVRRCRRGGAIRHLLKDVYFFTNRPLHELRVHQHLYDQGFAVPEPLGVCWERHGVTFRGAIATREVEGVTLLEYLAAAPVSPEFTLERTGKLIREMHDLGVYHADLQVRNILIAPVHPYIIDFDKASLTRRLSTMQCARNLLRLRRSFDRNFLPLRLFESIQRGYGMASFPAILEMFQDSKSQLPEKDAARASENHEDADL